MLQEDQRKLPADVAKTLAPTLRFALGHPTRRRILRALNEGGDAQALETLAAAAPNASANAIYYHTQVLEECGSISLTDGRSSASGDSQGYVSDVADDRLVIEALRATQLLDDEAEAEAI